MTILQITGTRTQKGESEFSITTLYGRVVTFPNKSRIEKLWQEYVPSSVYGVVKIVGNCILLTSSSGSDRQERKRFVTALAKECAEG